MENEAWIERVYVDYFVYFAVNICRKTKYNLHKTQDRVEENY